MTPSPEAIALLQALKDIPLDLPCNKQDFENYETKKLSKIQSAFSSYANAKLEKAANTFAIHPNIASVIRALKEETP